MQQSSTARPKWFSAAVLSVIVLGCSSTADAAGGLSEGSAWVPTLATGAWHIESGDVEVRTASNGYVVEVRRADLGRDGADAWALSAEHATLEYDASGRFVALYARGDVRVVARSQNPVEPIAYAMGEYAWVDQTGTLGVVSGPGVALIRDDWQIRATKIDIDFGAAEFALRGVASGPVRAQRVDR